MSEPGSAGEWWQVEYWSASKRAWYRDTSEFRTLDKARAFCGELCRRSGPGSHRVVHCRATVVETLPEPG